MENNYFSDRRHDSTGIIDSLDSGAGVEISDFSDNWLLAWIAMQPLTLF